MADEASLALIFFYVVQINQRTKKITNKVLLYLLKWVTTGQVVPYGHLVHAAFIYIIFFNSHCWGFFKFSSEVGQHYTTIKVSYLLVTVYCSNVYLKLLLVFVCFMIYFLLICILFFNQLGLLCLCQNSLLYHARKKLRGGMKKKKKKSTKMLLVKASAMQRGKGCDLRKCYVRGNMSERLPRVLILCSRLMLKALLSEVVPHVLWQERPVENVERCGGQNK